MPNWLKLKNFVNSFARFVQIYSVDSLWKKLGISTLQGGLDETDEPKPKIAPGKESSPKQEHPFGGLRSPESGPAVGEEVDNVKKQREEAENINIEREEKRQKTEPMIAEAMHNSPNDDAMSASSSAVSGQNVNNSTHGSRSHSGPGTQQSDRDKSPFYKKFIPKTNFTPPTNHQQLQDDPNLVNSADISEDELASMLSTAQNIVADESRHRQFSANSGSEFNVMTASMIDRNAPTSQATAFGNNGVSQNTILPTGQNITTQNSRNAMPISLATEPVHANSSGTLSGGVKSNNSGNSNISYGSNKSPQRPSPPLVQNPLTAETAGLSSISGTTSKQHFSGMMSESAENITMVQDVHGASGDQNWTYLTFAFFFLRFFNLDIQASVIKFQDFQLEKINNKKKSGTTRTNFLRRTRALSRPEDRPYRKTLAPQALWK